MDGNKKRMDQVNVRDREEQKPSINGKWLKGKKEICDHCRISIPTFQAFLNIGLPVVILDSTYRAHADNLDEWLRQVTRTGVKKWDENAE